MATNMKLAVICKDCVVRMGVDERLLMPLEFVQVSQLSEYDQSSLSSVQYPGRGTTKITYKVAKTVKEQIDDHPSQSSRMSKH